jgi:hypothetical protein
MIRGGRRVEREEGGKREEGGGRRGKREGRRGKLRERDDWDICWALGM